MCLAVGKLHIPLHMFILIELASAYVFQNHQYFIRVVTKIDFSGITKNCSSALVTIYDQLSLNMASQKEQLVLANIHKFALEASRRPHMI